MARLTFVSRPCPRQIALWIKDMMSSTSVFWLIWSANGEFVASWKKNFFWRAFGRFLKEHCCIKESEFHNITNTDCLVWFDLPHMFESLFCSRLEMLWIKQNVLVKVFWLIPGFQLVNLILEASCELLRTTEESLPKVEEHCCITYHEYRQSSMVGLTCYIPSNVQSSQC